MKKFTLTLFLMLLGLLTSNFAAWAIGAPVVVSYNPAQNATSVPVNQELVLTFDMPVFPRNAVAVGNSFIRINAGTSIIAEYWASSGNFNRRTTTLNEDGDAVFSYTQVSTDIINTVGNSLIINLSNDPGLAFIRGQEYHVTIGNRAIYSTQGSSPVANAFAGIDNSSTIWSFTIEGALAIIDGSRSPAHGATGVSRNPVVTVRFTEPVQWGSAGLFRVHRASDGVVAASFGPGQIGTSISADQLSISFEAVTLAFGTEYYITMTNDFVRSLGGVSFPGISDPAYWRFTTEASPPVWAANYPRVVAQNADGFTFQGQTNQTGTMFFVVTSTGTAAPTAAQVSGGLDGSGQPAHIAFSGAMTANTLLSHLENFNIHTPLGNHYFLYAVASSGNQFSQVVRVDIDRIAPMLLSGLSFPAAGYEFMQLNQVITLVFSEPVFHFAGPGVAPLTAANFELLLNNAPVDFTLSVNSPSSVTLTPVALVENGSYTIRKINIADQFGNRAADGVINFETDKNNIWSGGGPASDWLNPDNWLDGNHVAGKSVTIPAGLVNFPVIDAGTTINVHNLTVAPGASLRQNGGTINISGLFALQSSPAVNASYLPFGGTLNVDGSRIRIEQVLSYTDRTYMLASPVIGATPASIGVTNLMFSWSNAIGNWVAFTGAMQPGIGYAARSTNNLVFSGSIFRDAVNVPVTYSSAGFGWNLLGNPYSASIDWDLLQANYSEIDNSYWIWQQLGNVFGVYNGVSGVGVNMPTGSDYSIIPSNHSFFVRVRLGIPSSTVGFTPHAMVNNTVSYLKSAGNLQASLFENVKIIGRDIATQAIDEIALVFAGDATPSFDKFDSEKRFARANGLIELFTRAGINNVAINGLPWDPGQVIPLGFSVLQAGTFSISMGENNSIGREVLLFDGSNLVANLTRGESYTFTVNTLMQNHDRFSLRLEGLPTSSAALNIDTPRPNISAHARDRHVYLVAGTEFLNAPYLLHDVSGRVINSGKILQQGEFSIGMHERGVYILRVAPGDGKGHWEQKVVVF